MSRASVRIGGGGGAVKQLVDQPYFLKPMPGNPYMGAVHDGTSTGYNEGFSHKPMNWLYRWRHNSQPIGIARGLYNRNPGGKQVHWLEVSTIEKFRLQAVTEEALLPMFLNVFVLGVTAWQAWRYFAYHPDLSLYNVALWTTKPFCTMHRAAFKHELGQPVFKYIQRTPEMYSFDPLRELYKLGVAANDPYLERVKAAGREDELYMYTYEYTKTKPNLADLYENDHHRAKVSSIFSK
jgi:hypothetical protein